MKWVIYIVLLLGVWLLPGTATDVAKLIPVEVVALSEEEGIITIEADTGDWGQGRSITEAIGHMEETASGIIYLDTAEYVLMEEGMEAQLPALRHYLKDSIRICYGQEGIPLEGIGAYLDVHRPGRKLSEPGEIPTITESDGRYQVERK